jgi:uncharacterized protein (TIGR02646 family)
MRYIQKGNAPEGIVKYRQKPNANYTGFKRGKKRYEETKKALCEEQGYICCYCGREIKCDEQTQIEHLYPKSTEEYKEMQLDYETNLLACCDGGKANRHLGLIDKTELFCETVKLSKVLPVNPLMKDCQDKFLYDITGEVVGVGKDAEVTIKILNLNSPIIKNLRKGAIDYYEGYCKHYTRVDWLNEIKRLNRKKNGKFDEFCFVSIQYIKFFKL